MSFSACIDRNQAFDWDQLDLCEQKATEETRCSCKKDAACERECAASTGIEFETGEAAASEKACARSQTLAPRGVFDPLLFLHVTAGNTSSVTLCSASIHTAESVSADSAGACTCAKGADASEAADADAVSSDVAEVAATDAATDEADVAEAVSIRAVEAAAADAAHEATDIKTADAADAADEGAAIKAAEAVAAAAGEATAAAAAVAAAEVIAVEATAAADEEPDIMDEVRLALRLRGPSERVLDMWERNSSVREILRWFMLETAIGQVRTITLNEVDQLFQAMGLTKKEFVSKFTSKFNMANVDRVARIIFGVFISKDPEGRDRLKVRDLFRLLEMSGMSLRKFGLKFPQWYEDSPSPIEMGPKIGGYRIVKAIGSGFEGPCVYLAENAMTRKKVAMKWPAKPDEVAALREIHKRVPAGSPGLPLLLSSGYWEGRYFMATELLGSPLTKVFERLQNHSVQRRWDAIQIIGRLLLRRLEVIHRCGYVHCDISPENFLLGPARGETNAGKDSHATDNCRESLVAPYLVDFGWARRFPNGGALRCDHGSVEWNSIRSASSGERRPEDDLEALGWMLIMGIVGSFPWCQWLGPAYERWHSQTIREGVIARVRDAKTKLLNQGWGSLAAEGGKYLDQTPQELRKFVRICHDLSPDNKPDYDELASLLGGDKGLDRKDAEQRDLRQYKDEVVPWL